MAAQSNYDSMDRRQKRFVSETLRASRSRHSNVDSFFPEIALTFYAFVTKLSRRLQQGRVRDVFFLSREGQFLKQLFDHYQNSHSVASSDRVRSHYLVVSRRSTFIPSLRTIDTENFETLFRQYRALSLFDVLQNLNFATSEIAEVSTQLGVDPAKREPDMPTSETWAKLLANPVFRTRYEEKRSEQKRLLRRYIEGFGVDIGRGLHLVDVGWKGTIQDHLHRVFNGQTRIDGYYLGLVALGAVGPTNQKHGVLFAICPTPSPFAAAYYDNRPIFEILLGASHGSADRYVERDGNVVAETLELETEKEIFRTIVQPQQRVIEAIFCDLASTFAKAAIKMDELDEWVARVHARFSFAPTQRELDFFKQLEHHENFGVFGMSRFTVSDELPLRTRIANLKRLIRAPHEVLAAGWWPPLTLQQLGLGGFRHAYAGLRFARTFWRGRRRQ